MAPCEPPIRRTFLLQKVIFISEELDNAGLSANAFRVLAHLARCQNDGVNFNATSVSAVCRINEVDMAFAVDELREKGFFNL